MDLHRDATAPESLGNIVVNDAAPVARAAAEALGRLGAAGWCEPPLTAAGTLALRAILQALGLLGEATGELPVAVVGRSLLIATLGESPVDRTAEATILASSMLSEGALAIGGRRRW